MEPTAHASRLRYLDADDVEDDVVDYDGLDVYGTDGKKIGDVDGFIIDPEARRVHYIVVDSGGWFTSRRLLLPIGHATIAADRKSMQVAATRDVLGRLPRFDEDRFHELKDEELQAFERDTVAACCPDERLDERTAGAAAYGSQTHYQQPDWWTRSRYAPERLRPIERGSFESGVAPARIADDRSDTKHVASSDIHNRDLVTARESGDVSPHPGGRAQPGDVLGLETGGERTGLGETSEDEDKRRRDAERAAAEDRRDVKDRSR